LAPSSTLEKYKADLIDEVEPAIIELVEKAEAGLQALQNKEKALETKVCLFNCLDACFDIL